jgi:hypothetical protein
MQTKLLQTADKLLFVKQLYDYSSRAVNLSVKAQYAEKTGMSERSFGDKMNTHRSFKGQELDIVEQLYNLNLGQAAFDNQLSLFIAKMSDGDARTIDNAQTAEIKKLTEQNDQMATSHILIS